jgi:hypothetical protein
MKSTTLLKKIPGLLFIFSIAALTASCGGGGDDDDGDSGGPTLFKIGGEISGLTGTVVLQNNGSDSLTVNANGSFTFATGLADGSDYLVTVSAPPAGQACNVSNGSGTIIAANISNITVTCIAISAPPATAAMPTLGFDIKTFRFTWTDVADATSYRLMENADGSSGFTQVGADITQGVQNFDHSVALYQRSSAEYFLQSCNSFGCTDADTITVTGTLAEAVGYFKASNTDTGDEFGIDVALSADGNTLAVGAKNEASNAGGVNGDESNESATSAGAVYIYINNAGSWAKQAYIKADSPATGDEFGTAVSLSADGNLLAVGAPQQSGTGSVYTFTRSGGTWIQQDSFKALITGTDLFGDALSLSDDGSTLAVGAKTESSTTTGIGSTDDKSTAPTLVGATYIFTESAGNWSQQEYIKADNADGDDFFGASVSLSSDGNTLAVGAVGEDSDTSGIGSTATDTVDDYGAVYVFSRSGTSWTQQEYIKASDSGAGDNFGSAVSLSNDGNTLAVGATFEDSMSTAINGDDSDNNADGAGAAYVFSRSGTSWSQQAYVKASNTGADDNFGRSVSLSADGDTLAVGAVGEQSSALGVNGDEIAGALTNAGASYVYVRDSGLWSQQAYLKASNTESGDSFGTSIELSGDGATLAVGARNEDGGSSGVGGDGANNAELGSGAVYLY